MTPPMLIYILRHGDAVQSPELHDSDRPLSEIGERQAATVGIFLKTIHPHPAAIVSSPLVRATQTAEIVSKSLAIEGMEISEFLVPGTRKTQLVEHLNHLHHPSVLLVGHEPHLSQTISLLISGREDLPIDIRKCSLGCLLASDPVRPGHAMLQWLLTAEQMSTFRDDGRRN